MAYTTINKSTAHFNTVTYTGNGSAGHAITGVGFQPDWTWIKSTSASYNNHTFNVLRGVGKSITTNENAGEITMEGITAFGTDGFTLGSNAQCNNNSSTFKAMNWKAGGAGSTNYDGSINSTVSANTTAGFSIVTYTGNGSSGATIGHGLGAAPEVVLVKKYSSADNWTMLHPNVSASKYMRLDSNTGEVNDNVFNNTRASSTVFTVDSDGQVNGNGNSFIAYCFKKTTGFFTTNEYTGNGSTDGPFLYCGFKPTFVIIKRKTATNNWFIFDNKTSPRNPTNSYSRADTDAAAGSYDWLDLVSNGIKIRNTSDGANDNNQTYLFFAWGQTLVGSNNVPATAR
jgi:hypothetical protein